MGLKHLYLVVVKHFHIQNHAENSSMAWDHTPGERGGVPPGGYLFFLIQESTDFDYEI